MLSLHYYFHARLELLPEEITRTVKIERSHLGYIQGADIFVMFSFVLGEVRCTQRPVRLQCSSTLSTAAHGG